jgi:hypothetical protein
MEVKLNQVLPGYINAFCIGMTSTDPESLPESAEEPPAPEIPDKDPGKRREMPAFARELPGTYTIGYTNKVYWGGQSCPLPEGTDLTNMAGLDSDKIGFLITNEGDLKLYINKLERLHLQAAELGVSPIPTDGDYYGVVDLIGQAGMVLLDDSYGPPDGAPPHEAVHAQIKKDLRRNFKSPFGELPKAEAEAEA